MKHTLKTIVATTTLLLGTSALAGDWDEPQEPFLIHGGSYYVGPHGISAVLVTSPAGHILIDGGTEKSPKAIAAHIRQLGFKVTDIQYILTSHEHMDHAGGIAALQKLSGAVVIGSPKSVAVLASGKPDRGDPQFGNLSDMAPVANTRAVKDGEVVKLGPLALTAHYTPGHTQGGLSWTWQSTEKGRTVAMVFADSLNAVTAEGFRYGGSPAWPTAKSTLEASIAKVAALKCDVLVSAHPEGSDLWERKAAQARLGSAAFIDPDACRKYADRSRARLARQLTAELTDKAATGH
ncbi:subclass B3 metallo-beta-lactamase [Pseudoduganella buxea]|uniref:Subclass B3 metallo-beta-lactamase n=1 Tax=Pseudoduganella buxea TaxID=1949069 RepID=A0A6I3T332_9BURK|nr:subclass B3 metallo-beta-lactamase [Pseudoduganella buxea]MTV54872.1 subclass B3 metallo-beta-lactamase [Pseudoduganella buxea]GGC21112.1 CAU/MBL1b family subclass B3 metallo-beta-lactamase [Pseudoduganella buxea]